jgi:hypothetical protein
MGLFSDLIGDDSGDSIGSSDSSSDYTPDIYSISPQNDSGDTSSSVTPSSAPTDSSFNTPSGAYPLGSSGIDSQQMLGHVLDPNVPIASVAAKLANEGKDNPSFLSSLANQLGSKIFNAKDPLSSITHLVDAISLIRGSGSNTSARTANLAKQSALISGIHSGYNGSIPVASISAPKYVNPNSFITTPPNSAGPLTLIKTS